MLGRTIATGMSPWFSCSQDSASALVNVYVLGRLPTSRGVIVSTSDSSRASTRVDTCSGAIGGG